MQCLMLIIVSDLDSSNNCKAFINQEFQASSKCWTGSPMETAFSLATRKCTHFQRDHLPKLAKLLVSKWNFLDLVDEIVGISVASLRNQVLDQQVQLFERIKMGLKDLHTVCCQKIFSILTAMLFDEFAFAILKVLLNLNDDARNDVQLVINDYTKEDSMGANLMGLAAKVFFLLACFICILDNC